MSLSQFLKKYLFKKTRLSEDLLIILNIAVFTYLFASYFNVFDFIYEITRPYKRYGIDSLVIVAVILALVLIVFAISSYREIRRESLERRRAEEELKERTEQLKTLWEGGKKIASIVSKEQILPWIADQACKLLEVDDCYYRIREGDYLVRSSGTNSVAGLMEKKKLRMGEGLSGKIAEEKRSLIIEDIQKKKGLAEEYREKAQKLGYTSFVGVPLLIEESREVLGVLNVVSKKRRGFAERDVELLSSLADQATIALENAELFEELEKAKKELENWGKDLENKVEERTKELKEVYSRLVLSERLAATGRLAGSIANEINNPLQAIDSFISSVMDNLGKKEKKNRDYLQSAREGVKRISSIVRKLLAFQRQEESEDAKDISDIFSDKKTVQ